MGVTVLNQLQNSGGLKTINFGFLPSPDAFDKVIQLPEETTGTSLFRDPHGFSDRTPLENSVYDYGFKVVKRDFGLPFGAADKKPIFQRISSANMLGAET